MKMPLRKRARAIKRASRRGDSSSPGSSFATSIHLVLLISVAAKKLLSSPITICSTCVPLVPEKSGALGWPNSSPQKRGAVWQIFALLMMKASPFLPIWAARTMLSMISELMVVRRIHVFAPSWPLTAMMKWGSLRKPRKTSLIYTPLERTDLNQSSPL